MKIGYGLVATLAAACGAVAMAPVHAQGVKSVKTVKPAMLAAVPKGSMSEVVGSINEKQITFGEVVARAQKENPNGFNQTVAQLLGLDASSTLFGPAPKSAYTVTKPRALALLREKNPQMLGDMLKTMLEVEAVDREVKKQNVTVTIPQVDKRIDQFMKMLRTRGQIPQGVTDEQFLAQNKVSRDTLRKNFMVQARLYTLIQQDFVEKRLGHKLSPEDFFKTRHILVQVPPAAPGQSPADVKKADDAALAKITQIAADIEAKKKTFEQAAKESSDDPGSKEMGGELGIQMRTVFAKEFEAATYTLKPGETSKPIRTQFGYHLIQLEARGAGISDDDRQAYLDNFESGQMQLYLRNLMTTKYKVVNKLARAAPMMPGMMPPGQ